MRIPVFKADLTEGHFTKIARVFAKLWSPSSLSLMQAQNKTAFLFGYRNLHDLQGHALGSVFAQTTIYSRDAFRKAIAWKAFRTGELSLEQATQLAAKLPLQSLCIDQYTTEYHLDKMIEEDRKNGRFLVMDEAWQYMNPHWEEKTPQLLDAGIPAYNHVVLPDGSFFSWSKLEMLLKDLPEGYLEDLASEPQYASLSSSQDQIAQRFFLNELFPAACEPLAQALESRELPNLPFSICWVFDEAKTCVGRVLRNEALGGVIPVLFSKDGSAIFHALADLLCGKSVPASQESGIPAGDSRPISLALTLTIQRGRDLDADLRASSSFGSDSISTRPLTGLGLRISAAGQLSLVGNRFVEEGQTYLRSQSAWLSPADIPEALGLTLDKTAHDEINSNYALSLDAIPASIILLQEQAEQRAHAVLDGALEQTREEKMSDRMLAVFQQLAPPAALETYCQNVIDEDLPLRREEDLEDDPDLIEERRYALQQIKTEGSVVKLHIEALASYSDMAMGVLLLLVNGEYPGSRFSGMVSAYSLAKQKERADFLAAGLLHAACCQSGDSAPVADLSPRVIAYAAVRLAGKIFSPNMLHSECLKMKNFEQKLKKHVNFVASITKERERNCELAASRKASQFLYFDGPISREKPATLADFFAHARSHAVSLHPSVN